MGMRLSHLPTPTLTCLPTADSITQRDKVFWQSSPLFSQDVITSDGTWLLTPQYCDTKNEQEEGHSWWVECLLAFPVMGTLAVTSWVCLYQVW